MSELERIIFKLYREFRKFRNLSEDEKLVFKAQIAQKANQRTEAEKEEYRKAMKANVLEIKENILEIKRKLDKSSIVSA